MFNEAPFKSIICDIKSNISKGGHKLVKNGLKYTEEMKDLTYSQKVKKNLDDCYGKYEIKVVKHVKYLSDDFVYEDIRCLFNETSESNEIKFYEVKSYEVKPYEVEYCEVRSDEIKSYEIDYIDIKPREIKSY